ncbi:DUF4440 domain-containing protein [Planococcus sp. ISL-109]|uniref:nuclear transport factor 2 family protein n=1 Tax=Planococcus sp. ISL-109 TaxID=2819166 RepID=UPI001BEB319B|nr:DUF4440 domain-containing protein [Planococcus sp. ISL-109]MBT2581495.1 DUF4440 domain-containing protein [Planococcus sp. ISL-109]
MENRHEQFLSLEKSHLSPFVRQSNRRMAEVLDDEFFKFGSSGGISRRSDFDGDGSFVDDEYHISRFEVRPLGPESVLAIYLSENRTTGTWRHRSSVWKKRENGWKLYFHQGTKTHGFNIPE